jgi:hypothetical protein
LADGTLAQVVEDGDRAGTLVAIGILAASTLTMEH